MNTDFITSYITRKLAASPKPIIVTISGPSGSGKSSVVRDLCEHFKEFSPIALSTDNYYIGKTRMLRDMPAGEEHNFDHPAAMNIRQLSDNLHHLLNGKSIDAPLYDMFMSEPKQQTQHIIPSKLIFVEGIAANLPPLRELSDVSICVTAPFETRLARCIARDQTRNGRDEVAEREHFLHYVEPSYRKYYAAADHSSPYTIPTA